MYGLLTEIINSLADVYLNEVEREKMAYSKCHSDNKCSCGERCCEKECNENDGNPYKIKENDNEYVIHFTDDFDGYKVEIEYEDYTLKLSARKKEGNKTTTLTYVMSLPDDIDDKADMIKAKNIEGNNILVTIPKVCKNKCRKIEIQ